MLTALMMTSWEFLILMPTTIRYVRFKLVYLHIFLKTR